MLTWQVYIWINTTSYVYPVVGVHNRMNLKNQTVLKLPIFYSIFGGVALAGTLTFGISELLTRTPDQWLGITGFLLIFSGLSVSILLAGQLYRVELTETELIQTTWLGRTKRLKWVNISKISFWDTTLELTITDGIAKIKVHSYMLGFSELVSELEQRMNSKREEFGL